MRMVRCMCGVKLQERVLSKGLRETRIRRQTWYYSKTGCDGMGMSCKKEDNDWVKKCMKWRVQGQEVDQRKLGERLWKKTVRT